MRNRTLLISILLITLFTVNVFSLGELSAKMLKKADKHHRKGMEILNETMYLTDPAKIKEKEDAAAIELKEAINYYKKVLDLDPGYMEAFTKLTDIYMLMNDYDTAEEFTKKYMKRNRSSHVYFRLATIYQRQQKWDLAISTFNKIFAIPKDRGTEHVTPYIYHSLSLIYEAKYNESEKKDSQYLDKAIDYELKALKYKIEGLTQTRIAALYKYKGDTKAALKAIDEAIATAKPNDILELKILKAGILEDSNDFDAALIIYDQVLSEDIDNDRLEQIGVRFLNNKKYKKSAEIFERIINSTPKPKEDLLQKAYEGAAKSYQGLEREAKANGDSSLAQEYHLKSKSYYSKITSGSSGQTDALIQEAADALTSGNFDEAIILYEKVIAAGAADFYVYMDLGNAYFSKKDFKNAEENFTKASGMKVPSKYGFQVYYNLGYTRFILGLKMKSTQPAEAKEILKKGKESLEKAKTYATSTSQNEAIDKRIKQIDQTLKSL
ncbi:tetratricopeptide repeat protein [Candidatus Dependentiae bacterium]|nr:tetratricopeptide repeat protein [Candidatus Dependentiae bacterium]